MNLMNWEKQGKIFTPNQNFGWINSHAQVPTAIFLENKNILRVYFSTRSKPGTSNTTFLDLNANNLSEIIKINSTPILDHGRAGTFDEHGIMPASILKNNNEILLYYSGWQRSVGVPYNNYTGLAISNDDGLTFKKFSEAPIIDRNSNELYSSTSPSVLLKNNKWHMWYCSGTNWHVIDGKLEHTYNIKYATSDDGRNWNQTGVVCIKQKNKFEAITRPSVIFLNDEYHMWYCYRGSNNFRNGNESYKIGYANSKDGINWTRLDHLSGINTSKFGWDSEMIAYPEIIKCNNDIIMLYNGNSFGKEGFGYAILKI